MKKISKVLKVCTAVAILGTISLSPALSICETEASYAISFCEDGSRWNPKPPDGFGPCGSPIEPGHGPWTPGGM